MKGGTAAIVVAAERLARAGGSPPGSSSCCARARRPAARARWRWPARRARWASAARCWWPSRRRTTRASRTRASCGPTRWRAGRPRTARCRTWARTRSTRSRRPSSRCRTSPSSAEHPLLGAPTVSLGTFSGGININSVPDRAEAGIDVRTVPGLSSDAVLDALRERLGEGIELSPRVALDPIDTDPSGDWVQTVFSVMGPLIGETPEPRGLAYFTDAAALSPAYGTRRRSSAARATPSRRTAPTSRARWRLWRPPARGSSRSRKRWCGL